jgi:multidrug efflux pump subunit AcrA (membrane-fusion protein)
MPLSEVQQFIQANGHLPNVPSAKEIEAEGLSLGETAKITMEKVEELTLYTIEQQKQLDEQKRLIEQQQQTLEEQRKLIEAQQKALEEMMVKFGK